MRHRDFLDDSQYGVNESRRIFAEVIRVIGNNRVVAVIYESGGEVKIRLAIPRGKNGLCACVEMPCHETLPNLRAALRKLCKYEHESRNR